MRRLAVAFLLALVPSPAALAAAGDEGLGFGVQPLDSPRGYFELRGEPGDRVSAALMLTNPAKKPVTVELRRQDAGTAATGGVQYEPARPGGTGRWLDLDTQRVELAPGAAQRIVLTARIPRDAKPGDHYAGLVAYDVADLRRIARQEGEGAVQLQFISRFGVTLRYRVPGPAATAVGFAGAKVESTPKGAAVQVRLRNPGGRLVPGTAGNLEVEKDGERVASTSVRLTSFLPGTDVVVPVPLDGAPGEGTYRVTGTIRPENAPAVQIDERITVGEKAVRTYEATTGRPAPPKEEPGPPWLWIALGAAGATALFALGRISGRGGSSSRRRAPEPRCEASPRTRRARRSSSRV